MGFKILVSTCLILIVLLLGTLTGAIVYTGMRVNQASKNITDKVNGFTQNVNNINTNLQNINTQLRADRQAISIP